MKNNLSFDIKGCVPVFITIPTLKEIPAERIYEQVLVGGGSILLKKHIEASGKVSLPIFVDEISANTKGYELLFKAACMG